MDTLNNTPLVVYQDIANASKVIVKKLKTKFIYTIPENTTLVTDINATDKDGNTIVYSISGTDSALFDINSATGVISFKISPDFENPTDNGANNLYNFKVTISANAQVVTNEVEVTVLDGNDAPTVTSTAVTTVNVDNNYSYTLTASDDNYLNWSVKTATTLPSWLSLESGDTNKVITLAGQTDNSSGSIDAIGTSASFNRPTGIVVDSHGNSFVIDVFNFKIRKITPTGVVSTFAGTGGFGSVDNDIGTLARFNLLRSIAIDSNDTLYVVESEKIRKITSAGKVTTLVTVPTFENHGLNFIAVDSEGNIFVTTRPSDNRIIKITPAGVISDFAGTRASGVSNGIGTNATFAEPKGIAIDSDNNLYIAEGWNRIRKITPNRVVTTFVSIPNPNNLTMDKNNNIYVTNTIDDIIKKITPQKVVTTFAGTGTAGSLDNDTGTLATFNDPIGISLDNNGNIYIADYSNHKIRKILVGTKLVGMPTIANGATATQDVNLTLSDGTYTLNHSFIITVNGLNITPTISNATAGQTVNDTLTIAPFSTITLADANGDDISVTITLDNNEKGTLSITSITSRSVANAQIALREIVFTPTSNRVATGSTETTTFTIILNDGTTNSISNDTTTVVSINATTLQQITTDVTKGVSDTTGTIADGIKIFNQLFNSNGEDKNVKIKVPTSITATTVTTAKSVDTTVSLSSNSKNANVKMQVNNNGTVENTLSIITNGVTTTTKIDVAVLGSIMDVSEDKIVMTYTTTNNKIIKATINIDGSISHIVENEKITKASSNIQGAITYIEDEKVTTTVLKNIDDGTWIFKVIVQTDENGRTQTKYIKEHSITKVQKDLDQTLDDNTPYPSGNDVNITIVDGILYIITSSPIDNNLKIK